MIRKSPHQTIMMLFGVLLISVTLTAPPAEAGLLDHVQSANTYAKHPDRTAPSNDRIEPSGRRRQGGGLQEGTGLVKEGSGGHVNATTSSQRADEFVDEKVHRAVRSFLKAAADNLKLKVSNPLEGIQTKLGDALLGKAATAAKEKIQATTQAGAGSGVANLDMQYGTIDPRIALDINEEEKEWYQAETGIMDETPWPRAEVITHADENLGRSPASNWYAHGQGDGQNEPIQWGCENDRGKCPDNSWSRERQTNVRERNPWSDREDGAHETENRPATECRNAWGDIATNCGDGYQGDGGRFDGPAIASDVQGRTYRQAVDRLLGTETTSSSDAYSASDEGYKEALAQLEAEAAERERQAQFEAEAAERERQAQLEAETAEQQSHADSDSASDTIFRLLSILSILIPLP